MLYCKVHPHCTSADISKAVTSENDCLLTICVFCSTGFAFDVDGSRTLVAFKMEFSVLKLNIYIYVAVVLYPALKSIDKLRKSL